MLVLALIVILFWVFSLATGNNFDGYIHLLMLVVVVVLGIRYFTGKKLVD